MKGITSLVIDQAFDVTFWLVIGITYGLLIGSVIVIALFV